MDQLQRSGALQQHLLFLSLAPRPEHQLRLPRHLERLHLKHRLLDLGLVAVVKRTPLVLERLQVLPQLMAPILSLLLDLVAVLLILELKLLLPLLVVASMDLLVAAINKPLVREHLVPHLPLVSVVVVDMEPLKLADSAPHLLHLQVPVDLEAALRLTLLLPVVEVEDSVWAQRPSRKLENGVRFELSDPHVQPKFTLRCTRTVVL